MTLSSSSDPGGSTPPESAARIRAYHARTRHFPNAYARSLGYLDWDSQPDPFRRFEGAELVELPLPVAGGGPRYEPAFVEGRVPPAPVDATTVGQLLHDALGLSAQKEYGEARWWLRMNPSSGNLHPTEGYLVAGPIPGLTDAPAVLHYAPREHAVERRRRLPEWSRMAADLPPGAMLLGLSSIPWRESWKYGERALRYCQHDVGHAIAAVAVAAAGLGWSVRLVESGGDAELAALLGLDAQDGPEAEIPEALLVVAPGPLDDATFPVAQQRHLRLPRPGAPVEGVPARLSEEHHDWPVIDTAVVATERTGGAPAAWWGPARAPNTALEIGDSPLLLRDIVAARRSAVAMDGRSGLTAPAFFQILTKLVPGAGQVPFSALPWAPAVHLVLFAHRVVGVEPGLYLLWRGGAGGAEAGVGSDAVGASDPGLVSLRSSLRPSFRWDPVPGAPAGLPLYALEGGDVRGLAAELACGQAIAADGAFAVAMLADFGRIDTFGGWAWRRLHWEAGAVGQVLYLEAEASGVRGTGIGCFFDEPTHRALGLRDDAGGGRWKTLYHFTLGGPVEDSRLRTVDPYAARRAR